MIKVLHELGNLDGGGVARLLYDYYYYMNKERIHFDFLIYDFFKEGILEEPLQELGCTIYKIPTMQESKKKCFDNMKNIIAKGNYDIVHSHRGPQAFYFLSCAKKCGIKRRIVHSHLAYPNPSFGRRIKNEILLQADKMIATDLFACGRDAGIAMWGKHNVDSGKVHIMTNAINNESFVFSEIKRQEKRKELGLTDQFTVGIVGRLEKQKNYPFLMKIFREILAKKTNSVLIIVGRGTQEEALKKMALDMEINNHVLFLGVRKDVPELLNAFDVFVLPSLYEGLPVVLVEAQANGLPEIVADTITDEMAVTDLISYLPLGNPKVWCDKILASESYKRERYADVVSRSGYSIKAQAAKLEKFYLESVKNNDENT